MDLKTTQNEITESMEEIGGKRLEDLEDLDTLGERHAVYSGSRNLYPDMVTAAKSLVKNSSVDTVWFLVEDDEFPFDLPSMVKTINVKPICDRIFDPKGPNMKTEFTVMAMIRAAYTMVLPLTVKKVLQLDVDTVVVDDIDDIWGKLDEDGEWIAGVHETFGTVRPFGRVYLNAGFLYLDLEEMRDAGLCEKAVDILNLERWPYIDQDIMCKLGIETNGYVLLDRSYNEGTMMGHTEHPKVVHYVGYKGWQTSMKVPRREYLAQYRDISWEEALRCNSEMKSRLTL